MPKPILLSVPRFEQPDDVTCGPTCLAKVYRFYGYEKDVAEVITETPRNPDGGTMAVNLGISAMKNGFQPTIYPYGLRIFDPTWRRLDRKRLIEKLGLRMAAVTSKRLKRAIAAYVAYLNLGGRIRFAELTKKLLVSTLRGGDPILTGLSATYLYGTPREREERYDDIGGESAGHFVVVRGYYPATDRFVVADPFPNVPMSKSGRYSVAAERLLAAILLGDGTYDAVLLVLHTR